MEMDERLHQKDQVAKNKMKECAEAQRNIIKSDIGIGDNVLLKNSTQQGKLVPKFQHQPFEVIDRKGAMITAQRDQEVKAQNASHFQKVNTDINPLRYWPDEPDPAPWPTPPTLPSPVVIASNPVGSPSSPKTTSTSLTSFDKQSCCFVSSCRMFIF